MSAKHPSITCADCNAYLARREDRLPDEIVRHALAAGVKPSDFFLRYMRAIHERHLSGLSLDGTP